MAAKEQIQSTDINPINGSIEHGIDGMAASSSDPTSYNSRFLSTKRKQRLAKNQTDINGQSAKETLASDIETPFEKLKLRSLSPPPVLLDTDESDDNDENNSSTKIEAVPNNYLAQHRPSLPIIHSGYQRTKSHSVKLIRIDENNSCPKKAVRFADDFGLELSQMKLINTDELPYVPSVAFKDLQVNNDSNSLNPERVKIITYMEPQFQNPIHMQGFNDRVARNKIVLEQANAIDNRIYGTVRLISLGLHKRVKIRFTTNNWISFKDHNAIYINNSYDGICDRFSFTLEIDRNRICIGNTIQFCICYESFGGSEYWDNNYQQNYRFNCFSRTIPDYSI